MRVSLLSIFIISLTVFNNVFSENSGETQNPSDAKEQIYIQMIESFRKQRPKENDVLCRTYNPLGFCTTCNDGFFNLESQKCEPVEVKIENCVSYLPGGFCASCKDGYTYQIQDQSCVPNTIKGCRTQIGDQCTVSLLYSKKHA